MTQMWNGNQENAGNGNLANAGFSGADIFDTTQMLMAASNE